MYIYCFIFNAQLDTYTYLHMYRSLYMNNTYVCVYIFNSNLNLEMDELIVAICSTKSIVGTIFYKKN